MTHANKEWIRARADLALCVATDAAHSFVCHPHNAETVAELVDYLFDNRDYMTVYDDRLDRHLYGEPFDERNGE